MNKLQREAKDRRDSDKDFWKKYSRLSKAVQLKREKREQAIAATTRKVVLSLFMPRLQS